ncbi:alpha/beta hydrolase family protein [Tundrisphaera sp. TA3]|uniref:alpha/beta hydrolase family protein n=1 Tax=Tundrisphaera sp. TA3 TaxID=3435775 RepID=UPI003EBF17FB
MPRLPLLATVAVLIASTSAPAADALLFTASDLPGLAGGFAVPATGEYTAWAWTPASVAWSVAADGPTITLAPAVRPEKPAASWKKVGKVALAADAPARIVVAADDRGGHPVPALLWLSTDPAASPAATLDIARGDVKKATPPDDPRRTTARTNEEGADFRPPATASAWHDRARAVRERLRVALGLWPMLPKTDLHPKVYGTIEREGYAIDKVVLETLPGFYLAGNLFRPTGGPAGKRHPVILSPHGHAEAGRVNDDTQARCAHWAKLGAVVFLYDMVGYADSKPFGHAFLDDRLARWGLSLATLQTWNSIRALDWVSTRPDVDPAKVGVTGESGGGTQTFLLTALDDRVKVAAPVVMVSEAFQGGCTCENAAGLRIGTDNVEIAALAAPRPMKLVGATGDWTARTMTIAYPNLQMIYALTGATDRVSADVFDFPHNYNQTSRNAVYPFMGRWLLGITDPASTLEKEPRVEKPEDLYAYDGKDHPYPADAKTPEQLEAALIGVLGGQLDRLAPGADPTLWEGARAVLATAHRVRVGIEPPAPRDIAIREVRRAERDGAAILHSTVGRAATGERIPVVRITPPRADGRVTVVATGRGKAGLIGADGRFSPQVRALLDRGQIVVGYDPFQIGESRDPMDPAEGRPAVKYLTTYNPSLAGDRMQDLATVVAWARSLPDVREVNLVAGGEDGPLALLARPLLGMLGRTAVDLDGFDYGDGSASVPPGLDLPGVLQFGGLKAAAALAAPAPLRITGAGKAFGAAWPERAYALADASGRFRLDCEDAPAEEIAAWIADGD